MLETQLRIKKPTASVNSNSVWSRGYNAKIRFASANINTGFTQLQKILKFAR